MGQVYITKCRRFMIIRDPGDNYTLSYQDEKHERVSVGYPQLKSAQSEAQRVQDLLG